MQKVEQLAEQYKPKLILAGYSAYSRKLDFELFHRIARNHNAYLMVDMAHFAGLVATGHYPNPTKYADIVTTTTHKTLRGPRGGAILSKATDPYTGKNLARKIDSAVFPGHQGGPLDHVIAAKAIAFREAMQPEFTEYQEQVIKNAKALCEELKTYGFSIISDGTDNHLMLIDLRNKDITGKEAEELLDHAGICTNKNMIPGDTRSPQDPSGIRIGTPAVTTRGMKEQEMKKIAELMNSAIKDRSIQNIARIKEETRKLCDQFRIYK
jgi:glycine hydroxymethyltransferase